jgi:hypothetical protein
MTSSVAAECKRGLGRSAHPAAEASQPLAALPRAAAAAALAVLALGCDLEQGFRDTGRTLFPNQTTYIDAPGIVITRGRYRSLNLGRGTTPLIFARSQDSEDASLYVFEFAGGGSCAMPGVGPFRIWLGGPLTYFEGETLHFANERCEVESLTLSGVGHPLFNPAPYFIVPTVEGQLLRVLPREESVEEVVAGVRAVFTYGTGQIVWAGDELVSTSNWRELEPLAEGVTRVVEDPSRIYFFEVDQTIYTADPRIVPRGVAPAVFMLFEDACELSGSPGWVYFYQPCEERRTKAFSTTFPTLVDLEADFDPRYLRVYIDENGDPWAAALRAVDPATNLGTLFVLDPDGEEHEIGTSAALEMTALVSEDDVTWLLALVDVAGDVGRVVRFAADGAFEELATGVLRTGGLSSIVSDFDGMLGNYATLTDGSFDVVAKRVPPRGFVQTNQGQTLISVFSNFDGATGTLTLGPGPVFRAGREVARGVPRSLHSFLEIGAGIPGVAYLTDFDFERGFGSLGYHNYELDLTAPIRERVSDFLPGFGGVVYVVADGPDVGIWWARAR